MINSINNFAGHNQQIRQNPDDYAKLYAEQNGISVEEAKAELKAKYGDPQPPEGMSSLNLIGSNNNVENLDVSSIENELKELEEKLAQDPYGKSIFERIMDYLTKHKEQASSYEENNIINPETNTITGPQKEGDPQFHFNPMTGTETGPQQKGDFQHPNQEYKKFFNMFQ